jgi:hypothetical protein
MKLEITIYSSDFTAAKLSTIRSESSFGRPVLIVDGQTYRPSDILPSGLSAFELVQLFFDGWETRDREVKSAFETSGSTGGEIQITK